MKKQPLADLLHDLEQEMLRLGYTNGSMGFIETMEALLRFAQERKQLLFRTTWT